MHAPPRCETFGWAPLLLCLGLTVALPIGAFAFPRSGTVAVIAAPGADLSAAIEIVTRAEGALLRAKRGGRVLLARSDRADFALRLYAAGAWLVLNPVLAGGCDPNPAASIAAPAQDRSPA